MTAKASSAIAAYRPDIDGLRALAVLAVILFHLDKALLPGGFVGVDVFFVISGFLISLHILQEVERGRFSLVEFYRRRVKRIVPPMLVVLLATLLAAQLVLLPEDAERVADSALWSLLSLGNVYFWLHQDTSYFAAASRELPLLHLWSLGVEEQFYIVWPLLLMATYRQRRARGFFMLAGLLALASFGLAELWFERDVSFVYYMLPSRAGELLLGALVALIVLRGGARRLPAAAGGPLALAGLALVIGSMLMLAEGQVFPGLLAIPPTLGAALLILAGHLGDNRVSRLLALKPLVGVGRVSYSAYLWHWPLIAFFNYGHAGMSLPAGAGILVLTFGLAWLSYRWVEQPARNSRAPVWRIFVFQYAAPGGAIALIALAAMYIDGYGLRWSDRAYREGLNAVRDAVRPAYQFDYVCQRQVVTGTDLANPHCVLGAAGKGRPEVILWGDSNAAHYVGMVAGIAKEAGFRFRNIAVGACPPVAGDPTPFVTAARRQDCLSSAGPILAAVGRADVVIVSGAWSEYARRSDGFLEAFFATARSLAAADKLVIVLGKVPVIAGYDRRCREKALSYPGLECGVSTAPPEDEVTRVNRQLAAFAARTPNVAYFDVVDYLCREGICSAFDAQGHPLYYDPSHLSLPASWALGENILRRQGVPPPFERIAGWTRQSRAAEGLQRTAAGPRQDP